MCRGIKVNANLCLMPTAHMRENVNVALLNRRASAAAALAADFSEEAKEIFIAHQKKYSF